jgi:hypothetical protein
MTATNLTHPVEGTRCRDARTTHPEVLDKVVDTEMFILHVRFGASISAAPGSKHREEARTYVRW